VPPTLADRLVHILEAIRNIQHFLAGKTRENFASDLFLRLAVERSFEIISEASRRIPEGIKAQQSQVNWQGMADLGNRLRHAYHRVDANILWDIAERDLPPLKAFVEHVVQNEKQ
jgi:uncharacterized protein with HEPN domain